MLTSQDPSQERGCRISCSGQIEERVRRAGQQHNLRVRIVRKHFARMTQSVRIIEVAVDLTEEFICRSS